MHEVISQCNHEVINQCNHDVHENEHQDCHVDDNVHLCGQCGKLHSKYFIEKHHCLCQVLSNYQTKDFEEYISANFLSRAPPASPFI